MRMFLVISSVLAALLVFVEGKPNPQGPPPNDPDDTAKKTQPEEPKGDKSEADSKSVKTDGETKSEPTKAPDEQAVASPEKPAAELESQPSGAAEQTEAADFPPPVNSRNQAKDQFDLIGEQIAMKLRQLPDPRAHTVVQNIINNALYEASIGLHDGYPTFPPFHQPFPQNPNFQQPGFDPNGFPGPHQTYPNQSPAQNFDSFHHPPYPQQHYEQHPSQQQNYEQHPPQQQNYENNSMMNY